MVRVCTRLARAEFHFCFSLSVFENSKKKKKKAPRKYCYSASHTSMFFIFSFDIDCSNCSLLSPLSFLQTDPSCLLLCIRDFWSGCLLHYVFFSKNKIKNCFLYVFWIKWKWRSFSDGGQRLRASLVIYMSRGNLCSEKVSSSSNFFKLSVCLLSRKSRKKSRGVLEYLFLSVVRKRHLSSWQVVFGLGGFKFKFL